MKPAALGAALLIALSLAACDRPGVEPVTVPGVVPGPAAPA